MSINKQTKLESIFSNFKEPNSYLMYKKNVHNILRFIIKRQQIYHKYIFIFMCLLFQNKLYVQNLYESKLISNRNSAARYDNDI